MNAEIQTGRPPAPPEVERLYRLVGWLGPGDSGNFIPGMLRGSHRVAVATADGKTVGFARAISDGVSDAYIQDVMVDPAYRRQGIARALVRRLVAELRADGVDWIGLIAAPGCRELYQKIGFSELTGNTPMRYTGNGE